ncbi:DUF3019 domain-containing protein [Pseudoalteromonas sp. SSDWG2]|uniref:DUF3019 domain-containing protein n=1 Tax=Pseudoalteromonas sp. SSDWG2 TaxID=3139391 RepID=UPI003BAB993E
MLIEYFVALTLLPPTVQDYVAPSLEVSPHTCIAEHKATRCEIEVHVKAHASSHSSLCLVISLPVPQTECFNGHTISTTYRLTLESTTDIALTNKAGTVLAKEKISVGTLSSNNYRVRRRFGWGI